MAAQLHRVLAGVGMRRAVDSGDHLVHPGDLPVFQHVAARLRGAAAAEADHLVDDPEALRPADSYDGDGARADRGGRCADGI